MKVAGIIAEFNPLHNGHKYIIDYCKKTLGADYVVIVMSGDFVQRGAPAIASKFTRARSAIMAGADLVLELPVYYSLGSAEYFAEGAVSVLSGLGVVTDLVFGSEWADVESLKKLGDILVKEPEEYKETLQKSLLVGDSFPAARAKAVLSALGSSPSSSDEDNGHGFMDILSSPNSILALEYIKSLSKRNSDIRTHSVKRIGAGYHCDVIDEGDASSDNGSAPASAKAIRSLFMDSQKNDSAAKAPSDKILSSAMPKEALDELKSYNGVFLSSDSFSDLLIYKLLLEKNSGFSRYVDVNEDLSNRIISGLERYDRFEGFCGYLKTKNLTYTRISRCLMHILLNITEENMAIYKESSFTAYGRILAMKKDSSTLLAMIHENADFPVLDRLKDAESTLSKDQLLLFNETLACSSIYNHVAKNGIISEYRFMPVII